MTHERKLSVMPLSVAKTRRRRASRSIGGRCIHHTAASAVGRLVVRVQQGSHGKRAVPPLEPHSEGRHAVNAGGRRPKAAGRPCASRFERCCCQPGKYPGRGCKEEHTALSSTKNRAS